MTKKMTPEDAHDRLNRELWSMRLSGWKGISWTIVVCLCAFIFFLRIPTEIQFVRAEVTGFISLTTENGPVPQIGVIIDGQHRSARTRAQFVHPAKGEIICLRQTTYWPVGQKALDMTSMRFCDGTIATEDVE